MESQVTCGHVKPLLHASTLYGLRTGRLKRKDTEVQRAMDRSGDMIESMYRLLRQPNRHALEDMMSGLRVRRWGFLCHVLLCPYAEAIATASQSTLEVFVHFICQEFGAPLAKQSISQVCYTHFFFMLSHGSDT